MNVITYIAVASWCFAAYMLPVVAMLVWLRRKRDKTEIIQEGDWPVSDDWLRVNNDEL